MPVSLRLTLAAVLLPMGLLSRSASAQQGDAPIDAPADQGSMPASDSIQLVFEREVFTYPDFERRNPFRALTGEEGSLPRFEDMVLLGVVLSSRTETSIAVLGARPPGSTSDQPATRIFRLRSGESLGNVRVLEIRRRDVLFSVEDFGIRETRILTMRRDEPPPFPPAGEIRPEEPSDEIPPASEDDPATDTATAPTVRLGPTGRG